MTARKKLGTITRLGAAAALTAGMALTLQPSAVAAPAEASAAPVVKVTPSTGLQDGSQVTLSVTGLTPGTVYHVGQCAFVETGEYGCNKATAFDVVADAQGNVNTKLTVNSSFQAVVGAETLPWGTVNCKVTTCMAGLGSDSGEGGGQVISFA